MFRITSDEAKELHSYSFIFFPSSEFQKVNERNIQDASLFSPLAGFEEKGKKNDNPINTSYLEM